MTSGQAISKLTHDKKYSNDVIEPLKKEHDVMNLIKKKKVFVAWLKYDLSTYNNTCALYGLPRLNQEQFDLLKEVLL